LRETGLIVTSPPLPTSAPLWTLSSDPPVFLAGIPNEDYLGFARPFADHFGNTDAGFIIFPTWSIEREGFPEAIRAAHDGHLQQYPRHRLRFICNTQRETDLLQAQGLPAEFLNKNFTVSDTVFHPVADAAIEFDAIYNARFVADKRHDLAALVPRVAYVTYVENENRLPDFISIRAAIMQRSPNHVLLNEVVNGRPVWMAKPELNAASARAAVGLVLSPVEGSSYASMEYLLSGLPVVSTPSSGGRDVYFDPDFCIVCEPNAEAVRDAVAELKGRNLSREEVRARTIEKIAPPRRRFLSLIDEVLAEFGVPPRFAGRDWPFEARSGVAWAPYTDHIRRAAEQGREVLAAKLGLPPTILAEAQFEAQELEPIVAAIRSRPKCRLLVFGCGNDSLFWETLNADGETAFIEDDPKWAKAAAERISTSPVHLVSYGTQLGQWRALLDMPRALELDLPLELKLRKWDVIIVDGPDGHQPFSSGRMKSIYAASCLVAPGGIVFVHDCEREVEATYSAKYLADGRVEVTVRGRGLLRGYAF